MRGSGIDKEDTKEQTDLVVVEKNELGLKTGKGFYDYEDVNIQTLMTERIKKLMVILREIKM